MSLSVSYIYLPSGKRISKPSPPLKQLLEAGLLMDNHSGLPNKIRWGSMAESVAPQTAGIMLNGLLMATITQSFRHFDDGDPGEENQDDFRNMMKRKAWRVRCVGNDAATHRRIVLANFISQPLDHVWHRVQHLDDVGGGFKDCVIDKTNPFAQACRSMISMLKDIEAGHELDTLFWYYAEDPASQQHLDLLTEIRASVSSMMAQTVWRFLWAHEHSWIARLVKMVDARTTVSEKHDIAAKFFRAPSCCKEQHFDMKVSAI